MKRIFGISLITLSVSILLLHSFVPHHHSTENFDLKEILKKEPVKSPIDILKIGFHINLGSNHLENFQKSSPIAVEKKIVKKFKSNNLVLTQSANPTEITQAEKTKENPPSENKIFKSLFDKSFSYRGPPKNA